MEKGGVFLFDLNTPYKHENVLGNNCYNHRGTGCPAVTGRTAMTLPGGWTCS